MREIKFRAWNVKKKWYDRFDCIMGFITSYDDEILTLDPNKYTDPFILEQYTGLKDKNGKESFQGDKFRMIESGNIYTIIFKKGAFGYISHISQDFLPMHHLIINGMEWEIIGNIHEPKP